MSDNEPENVTENKTQFDLERTLNRLKRQINMGFSDENFATINWLMGLIQPHVEPEAHRRLASLWRDTYTFSCDTRELNRVIREMRPESNY
jgi:hypothetical protein